ncbi:hypothetical protein K438DRAFT_1967089 [Mycena galopus ATCC 62051]|nr:hypothetical protein K438DRAFT_1967089 [Mycena galopus ATCC 62051]
MIQDGVVADETLALQPKCHPTDNRKDSVHVIQARHVFHFFKRAFDEDGRQSPACRADVTFPPASRIAHRVSCSRRRSTPRTYTTQSPPYVGAHTLFRTPQPMTPSLLLALALRDDAGPGPVPKSPCAFALAPLLIASTPPPLEVAMQPRTPKCTWNAPGCIPAPCAASNPPFMNHIRPP